MRWCMFVFNAVSLPGGQELPTGDTHRCSVPRQLWICQGGCSIALAGPRQSLRVASHCEGAGPVDLSFTSPVQKGAALNSLGYG